MLERYSLMVARGAILVLLSLIVVVSFARAQSAGVAVSPERIQTSLGSVFDVDITVDGHAKELKAFQLWLDFDNAVLAPDSATEGTLLPSVGPTWFEWHAEGGNTVEISGAILGAGLSANGPGILTTMQFKTIRAGSSPLHFAGVSLRDINNTIIPCSSTDGTAVCSVTEKKGDTNADGVVNVIDMVSVANIILDIVVACEYERWSADCNEDGQINVIDLVGIANVILEIGTCPPGTPKIASSSVSVSVAEILVNDAGGHDLLIDIDTEVALAGAQFTFAYRSEHLTHFTPLLSERGAEMTMVSRVNESELIVVIYSEEGNSIPPGKGVIVEVPFRVAEVGLGMAKAELVLQDVILAGSGCQEIPVEEVVHLNWSLPKRPTGFTLFQNDPNPFNPITAIRYQITVSGSPVHTILRVYNILGQEVRTLVDEEKDAGCHTVTWDGRDGDNREVASGIYFYGLTVDGPSGHSLRETAGGIMKMTLVR